MKTLKELCEESLEKRTTTLYMALKEKASFENNQSIKDHLLNQLNEFQYRFEVGYREGFWFSQKLNKEKDEKTDKLLKALNSIAHIGVVMDNETGQQWDCDPIQVAQEALSEYADMP